MTEEGLRDEINKRLTLNWLIQGASQHAGMTAHHLVRDELNAIDPKLLRLYDQFALIGLLQYWHLDFVMLFGWPSRFWRRASGKGAHPFSAHPLLARYGGMLAAAGRTRALDRCKEKGVSRLPVLFAFQTLYVLNRIITRERPHRTRLLELARELASTVWGIATDRLDGDIANQAFLGASIPARTLRGAILRFGVVGLGGVERRGDALVVVARATTWQVLTKELVKGTAELICLHGLNHLSDDDYRRVMDAADWLEYEPWMLQTGGELWRHLLALMPDGQPVAKTLMHLARLPARSLESLMLAVIERPEWARELLASLGTSGGEDG
jgi:hypothetical protein